MKPQKAKHLFQEMEKKKPACEGKTYVIFEKYDGWYGYIDVGGDGKIKSRAGRVIPAVQHLNAQFEGLPYGRYIFEIMIAGVTEFAVLNGILNRSKGDCKAREAYLICHDLIPLGQENMPFCQRYNALAAILRGRSHLLRLCERLGISKDPNVWQELVEQVWERGGEGVILKEMNHIYAPDKRNADLMKIKEEVTLDLVVVDYVEGEGKYKNTLGALVVEDQEGFQHHVSGMTDGQRHVWWNNPNKILGQIVEVKAMKKLKDGSLREPRFKAVRYDKDRSEID